jgi:hypothetical protein
MMQPRRVSRDASAQLLAAAVSAVCAALSDRPGSMSLRHSCAIRAWRAVAFHQTHMVQAVCTAPSRSRSAALRLSVVWTLCCCVHLSAPADARRLTYRRSRTAAAAVTAQCTASRRRTTTWRTTTTTTARTSPSTLTCTSATSPTPGSAPTAPSSTPSATASATRPRSSDAGLHCRNRHALALPPPPPMLLVAPPMPAPGGRVYGSSRSSRRAPSASGRQRRCLRSARGVLSSAGEELASVHECRW